ncbi:18899_t:CDS:2, partial [Racocetra persica]
VYIVSYDNFTVSCEYAYGGYIYNESQLDCTQKIKYIYNSTASFPFIAIFKSDLTLTSHLNKDAPSAYLHINETGSLNMTYISFNINIVNNSNQTIQISTTVVQVFDPGNDLYFVEMDAIRNNQNLLNSLSKESSDFIGDSEYANTHLIGPGNVHILRYTKEIRKVLVDIPKSLFLSPRHERIPYITSKLATVSMPDLGNLTIFSIACTSTTIVTEEEKL